jgi:hypothetical protein
MKNTALIALSSPGDSENYYSQLLGALDENGDPWFKLVNAVLVCPACRKLERNKQVDCTHVPHTAHWLSKRKVARLKLLYKHAPATALREFVGMVVSDYQPCFNAKHIDQIYSTPRVVTMSEPDYIYVSADPSGGGPSHTAVASGYYNRDGNFVVSFTFFAWAQAAPPWGQIRTVAQHSARKTRPACCAHCLHCRQSFAALQSIAATLA